MNAWICSIGVILTGKNRSTLEQYLSHSHIVNHKPHMEKPSSGSIVPVLPNPLTPSSIHHYYMNAFYGYFNLKLILPV